MWKASTTSQWPSVGRTVAWVSRQGQSSSQLQDSKYSPSIFQLSLAIDDSLPNRSSWLVQPGDQKFTCINTRSRFNRIVHGGVARGQAKYSSKPCKQGAGKRRTRECPCRDDSNQPPGAGWDACVAPGALTAGPLARAPSATR